MQGFVLKQEKEKSHWRIRKTDLLFVSWLMLTLSVLMKDMISNLYFSTGVVVVV